MDDMRLVLRGAHSCRGSTTTNRNTWSPSIGPGGRYRLERVVAINWNWWSPSTGVRIDQPPLAPTGTPGLPPTYRPICAPQRPDGQQVRAPHSDPRLQVQGVDRQAHRQSRCCACAAVGQAAALPSPARMPPFHSITSSARRRIEDGTSGRAPSQS
jgi:hypothetical protein